MTYTDPIEQAVQHQLEIEHKARAWDALAKEAERTPLAQVLEETLEVTRGQG